MIRPARADELHTLQEIERAAGEAFRTLGMDAIADDEPPSIADLLAVQRAGRMWVCVDAQDRPVAYVMAELVDGTGHVEQVSVHPDHARRGLGRDLIEAVATWTRGLGLTALTLTTYAEVPWNAPYYARLGFEVVAEEDLGVGLHAIRKTEAARGLDRWPRVTMRRELTPVLPEGLTTRPLSLADAAAVTAVMAADELAAIGEVQVELEDIVSDWQRPSFDIATSTVGVFDGERLVGYAERSGPDRADAAVHPVELGRGIGTWLADWIRRTAREAGSTVIGMPVPQGSAGDRLLASQGFRVRWTSWILELPAGRAIEPRPLPEGFTIGAATEGEHRATWTVVEDAFLEWADRERVSFEDFAAQVTGRPGFEPWNLRVVRDAEGVVVAVSHIAHSGAVAFVVRLAVRRDLRGRGLAQALLADAFTVAREHGAVRSELSTDSRTGALSLYEKVGMQVTSTWVNRAADL